MLIVGLEQRGREALQYKGAHWFKGEVFILSPWASETSIPKTWSSVYDQLIIWSTALIGCYHLGIASASSLGLVCRYLQYHHQVCIMTMDWYIGNNISIASSFSMLCSMICWDFLMPLVNIFKCSVYLFRNVRGKTLSVFSGEWGVLSPLAQL